MPARVRSKSVGARSRGIPRDMLKVYQVREEMDRQTEEKVVSFCSYLRSNTIYYDFEWIGGYAQIKNGGACQPKVHGPGVSRSKPSTCKYFWINAN